MIILIGLDPLWSLIIRIEELLQDVNEMKCFCLCYKFSCNIKMFTITQQIQNAVLSEKWAELSEKKMQFWAKKCYCVPKFQIPFHSCLSAEGSFCGNEGCKAVAELEDINGFTTPSQFCISSHWQLKMAASILCGHLMEATILITIKDGSDHLVQSRENQRFLLGLHSKLLKENKMFDTFRRCSTAWWIPWRTSSTSW